MTTEPEVRSFLDLADHTQETLRAILDASMAMKAARDGLSHDAADPEPPLKGRLLAMIFEKPSTRTRVSFDVGMRQLGGQTISMSGAELQLGRGETIYDTAQVLSRFVDAIMIRTTLHDDVVELASHATVPVINGLTAHSHPCQVMADLMTLEERKGPLGDQVVAWCGDSNNVALPWIQASAIFGFELRIACPPDFAPAADLLHWAAGEGANISITVDPKVAVEGAGCVVTDAWVSMGDTDVDERRAVFADYKVDADLMKLSAEDAIFMHCLPAYRGEEVTDEVIDGPQSVVFDEAENRLHVQKGILAWCLGAL
ncbi:MAG: ornithine carbamoyltransferase [Hyphomicrobiales bacterium]